MRRIGETGMTLVELIISIAIMGIIAGAATALLSICLQAHAYGNNKSALHHEGLMVMERMTSGVRNTTFLLIPNGHNPTGGILAVSDMVNDDNDFYFGDPLFPRIDEDMGGTNAQSGYGIFKVDDDGDGSTDEGAVKTDDDEDGLNDEEILNGLDDDGDGSIDEDLGTDVTGDNLPGIAGMDDDGDGQVDEDPATGMTDEDEDGAKGEESVIAIVYQHEPAIDALWEIASRALTGTLSPPATKVALSTRVTGFAATYEAPNAAHAPRVLITLTLTGDDGESVTFAEYAYPRNIVQKTGKKVR
jgi:prepilin-type N-terminal cleavage/methylation domain-containing protein